MDIYEFIRRLNVNTFVEIGVHFGEDTKKFRAMHPNAHIVGFEPDPRNVNIIRDTGIDKICEFHPVALSNVNEVRKFHMSSGKVPIFIDHQHNTHDWTSSSSLKRPTGHLAVHSWCKFPLACYVNCVRLDDVASLKDKTIDFIWVDVQGAEDVVFSGAKDTLSRTRYVYTEYGTNLYEGQINREQLIALFGPNWSIVHDFGGDILLQNKTMSYYINLDHRTDRKAEFEGECTRMDISVQRFPGVREIFGGIGCTQTQVNVLKKARADGLLYVTIFEDDFQFVVSKEEYAEILNNLPPDYDVVMLSYNLMRSEPYNDRFGRALDIQTASGYIVHSRFYDKIINRLEEGLVQYRQNPEDSAYTIDMYWKALQPVSRWYFCLKRIGVQRASFSDIQGTNVDYGV